MTCTTRAFRVAVSKFFALRVGAGFTALAALGPTCSVAAETTWPQFPLPRQIQTFEFGPEMVVNGTPVRMQGFVSPTATETLAAAFRERLGPPLVEDRRGTTIILGRAEGRYYLTVQLTHAGSGTRGVIAVAKPLVNREDPLDMLVARHLLSAMPPGSTLASHTASIDGTSRADHDAIINSHSLGVNREYLQRMLRSDGFRLERESGPLRAINAITAGARTLWFKRAGAEAIAVLFSDHTGKSVIVLNRVSDRGAK